MLKMAINWLKCLHYVFVITSITSVYARYNKWENNFVWIFLMKQIAYSIFP